MKGIQQGMKKIIAYALAVAMSIPMFAGGSFAATDLTNHWAGNTINEWISKGLANGYEDGSFKPDNGISRAEFMRLVNNAYGFTALEEAGFKDIKASDWFYKEIQKAVSAGYIGGYPDNTIKPNAPISRQEASVIIAKVKKLTQDTESTKKFTDASKIESWSKGYIGAVVKAGYLNGYPNGSFQAKALIKRGEAIVALNNTIRSAIYDKAGTYGPATGTEMVNGDVIVKADKVILQNLHITGDLTIAEEVGDGDVTLNNIKVDGETFIRGGGTNSIHINGGEYNKIIVQKTANGEVRIVATDAKGAEIIISENAKGETLILEGKFDSVEVDADNIELKTQGNTEIKDFKINSNSSGSSIYLGDKTVVDKMTIESKIAVKGTGTVQEADVKVDGVSFEKTPAKTNISENVKPPVIETGSSGGSGGGGGGNNTAVQSVSGALELSAGNTNMTAASIQLKKDGANVGMAVNPMVDGSYTITGVSAGTGYTVVASLAGYYDFETAEFTVSTSTNLSGKDIQLARKEPIITTENRTVLTRGTNGTTIRIDLISGRDFDAQVTNLGHSFGEEAVVENTANWNVDTGSTGFTLASVNKVDDTTVDLVFTGEAMDTRAFSVQALATVIEGDYAFDSNELVFSIADDGYITDSTGDKELYYAVNKDVTDMKAVVVMVHGLAEHLGRYNEAAEALNAAGYGTYRMDNKGHGLTGIQNSDSGNVDDFREYYQDIDLLVNKAITENPGKPVYMLGHSMGGLLTSLYGVTYQDKLEGQILSGAATGPYYMSMGVDEDAFYAGFGGNPLFAIPNSLTSTVCRYPAVQNYYYVDPLRLTSFTAQLYFKTFSQGSKYLADEVADGEYTYPVFILHGKDDRIVSKAFSEALYANIDSVDKTLELYDGLFHESLNERNEKAEVIADIIAWLDARAEDKTVQQISGILSVSAGTPDLSTAEIQLKKGSNTYGEAVHPAADGSFSISVPTGSGYTLTASMEGYYEFSTPAITVAEGTDITNQDLQLARKEPIITTQNQTTIPKGTTGATIRIDLISGRDFDAQVTNLNHVFGAEADVENLANWDIDTGSTGFTVDSVVKIDDTTVDITFSGEATEARSFLVQALEAVFDGENVFNSNTLVFSVAEDGYIGDSTGNKELYFAKNTDVEEMKAIVIMVHGLAEHLGRYNEIAEALNAAGYGTYRMDNKGHGLTGERNGDSGFVEDFHEYFDDLNLLVTKAKTENPGLPVYMLGHSMGGLITAMYGVTYTDTLDGQILSGAATGPYYMSMGVDENAFYAGFGGNPMFNIPNSLTSTVCRYPAVQNYYYVDPLRLTSFTAQLYFQTFALGSKYLADEVEAGEYNYPVFITHGKDDRIVSKAFSEALYNNIDSADKTIELYDGLFHETLNERNEKTEVMGDMINWLDAQLAP